MFKNLFKIVYAPLAGCSDYPFRKMSARYQPDLMFCEMVKMEALLRKVPGTYQMLDYSEEMRPIGGQICGSNVALAAPAAKIIEELGFDVVDLNCGCPVDKVTKDGSGSGMLKHPEKIGAMIAEMVAAVKIPVTLKVHATASFTWTWRTCPARDSQCWDRVTGAVEDHVGGVRS